MEYQEIITEYNKGSLDISEIKRKMEIAKLLQGRSELRAINMVGKRMALSYDNQNMLVIPEIPERIKSFDSECSAALEEYFKILISSIKSTKAWKVMELVPTEYTLEKFKLLDKKSQFKMIYFLNEKYQKFLEYQRVADISNCLKGSSDINDEMLKKMLFMNKMFEALDNSKVRTEFYVFSESPKFLLALIEFKKNKNKTQKLEEFMNGKSKSIKQDYNLFSRYFSTEDFRDIAENILLTSKTLKTSANNVILAFCEMSEGELEQRFLEDEYSDFEKIEAKYTRFYELKKDILRDTIKQKIPENYLKVKQISKTSNSDYKKPKEKKEHVIEVPSSVSITNINSKKESKKNKEKVNPIIFTWLEREDISLGKRVGLRNLTAYLEDIHKKELETGIRTSLFLITNANKEITVKRMQEIQKRAKTKGMENLVEGALGGYSSFLVDSKGNITDMALMSDENRKKIIKLLDSGTLYPPLISEQIDKSEEDYIRYIFSDRKDKSITMKSLRLIKDRIMKNPRVKNQPIKLIPFIEGKFSGIDVVLECQLVGMRKLPEYYKSKYEIVTKKGENININLETLSEYTLEGRE